MIAGIGKVYKGSNEVKKIYLGEKVVYTSEAPIDDDAQAFLDAAKPFFSPTYFADIGVSETDFNRAISDFYVSLKDNLIYDKLKAFYLNVGATAGAHKFNGKDPRDLDAAFRKSYFGGITHDIGGEQG